MIELNSVDYVQEGRQISACHTHASSARLRLEEKSTISDKSAELKRIYIQMNNSAISQLPSRLEAEEGGQASRPWRRSKDVMNEDAEQVVVATPRRIFASYLLMQMNKWPLITPVLSVQQSSMSGS